MREALYLGTPVIATDNGMRPAGVDLIPIGDTEALANRIARRFETGERKQPVAQRDDQNLAEILNLYCQATRVKLS